MKKQFTCENCGGSYKATWTRGLCPTCRKRKSNRKYWKTHVKSTGDKKFTLWVFDGYDYDDDWLPPLCIGGGETHNDIVRRYYQQQRRLEAIYGIKLS